MTDDGWRWEAKGTLIYEDGDHCSVTVDRHADVGCGPVEVMHDLIGILDKQTTWELDRCVIELRSYQEARKRESEAA